MSIAYMTVGSVTFRSLKYESIAYILLHAMAFELGWKRKKLVSRLCGFLQAPLSRRLKSCTDAISAARLQDSETEMHTMAMARRAGGGTAAAAWRAGQRRGMFNPWEGWINFVWNRVDDERLREHGADR